MTRRQDYPFFSFLVTCELMLVTRSQVVHDYRQSCSSQLVPCNELSRAVVSLINDVVGLVQDVDVIRQLVGCQHATAARTAAVTLSWMVTLQTVMRRVRVLKRASRHVLLLLLNKDHAANSTRVLRHWPILQLQ
jgi:hypothetical protein